MDAIGRREKQEMLRAIAYEMQAGEEGLKGNLISADQLTRILTNYLRDQGFSEPREKANLLIQQLRERNFILCYRGADTYGFVHRTFLEYFCAMEIVHRFEKQRTLTFEQLRDEVFGQHWQDETWHEVLRLICGAIDPKFVGQLIEFLTILKRSDAQDKWFSKKEVGNLLLAVECFKEVQNRSIITLSSEILLTSIKQKVEDPSIHSGTLQDIRIIATAFGLTWQGNNALLGWLKSCLEGVYTQEVHTHYFAACALVEGWKREEGTLSILINCVQKGYTKQSAKAAALALVKEWQEHPSVLPFLKKIAQESSNQRSRGAALLALARGYKEDLDTLIMLKDVCQDESYYLRGIALEALGENWCDDPDVLHILKTAAHTDQDWRVRGIAVEILIQQNENVLDLFDILYQISKEDLYEREADFEDNPRMIAIQALVRYYPTYPKTLERLRDRAANDPDEKLRQWAQEQLKIQNVKLTDGGKFQWLKIP
jgi:hypothetical protein